MDTKAPFDPVLMNKLSRTAVRPGVVDPGLARAMHARHTGMVTDWPLAEVMSRHLGSVSDLAGVPIVYAQPAPSPSTQDASPLGVRSDPAVSDRAVSAPIVRARPARPSVNLGPSEVLTGSGAAAHPVVQMSPMPAVDTVLTEVAPSPVTPRAVVPDHAERSPSTPDFSSGEALPVSVPVVVPAPARPTPDAQGLPTATRAVPPSVDTVVGVARGEAPPDVVQRQTAAQPLPVLDSPTPNGGPDFRPPPGSRPPRVAQVKERRTVVTESRGVPPMHASRVDFPFLTSPLRAEVEVAGGIVVAAQRPRPNPVEPMVLVDLAVATARPVRDQPVAIDQRETPRSVARHVQLPGNSVQASTQPVRPETAHAAVPTTGPIDIARIVDLVHNRFVRRLAVEAERRGVR